MANAVTLRTPDWGMLPDLLTVDEVADYLRASAGFIYVQARSGALKPAVTRLGRSIRIRKDALGEVIASGGIAANARRTSIR